jgi:hypothetical protein
MQMAKTTIPAATPEMARSGIGAALYFLSNPIEGAALGLHMLV